MSKEPHGKFRKAFLTRSLNEVDQNDVSFQAFHDKPHLIGSQGLRGCLVIIIASRLGAIIGHIGPTSDEKG